jgi:hypothetical protein
MGDGELPSSSLTCPPRLLPTFGAREASAIRSRELNLNIHGLFIGVVPSHDNAHTHRAANLINRVDLRSSTRLPILMNSRHLKRSTKLGE